MRLHGLALTLSLLAAGTQLSAQMPQRHTYDGKTEPFLENDEIIINTPRPWPVAADIYDVPAALTAPFGKQNWHDHPLNRVIIRFFNGGEVLHFLDGAVVNEHWHAGDVEWSPANGWHYTSHPEGWDGPEYPVGGGGLMDIGIKRPGYPGKAGGGPLDPLKVDPKDFKLEFENSQVRVLRLKIAPQQSVPMHEYTLNHLIVYLTDQNEIRETSSNGKAEVRKHPRKDFTWDAPGKQKMENLTDKPLEALVIELKTLY